MRQTYDADHPDHEIGIDTDPRNWHNERDDKPASPTLLATVGNSQKHHSNEWPREYPDDTPTPAGRHWPHPRYTSTLYNVNTQMTHLHLHWPHPRYTSTLYNVNTQMTHSHLHWPHPRYTSTLYNVNTQMTHSHLHCPHPWYTSALYSVNTQTTHSHLHWPHPRYTSALYYVMYILEQTHLLKLNINCLILFPKKYELLEMPKRH